MLKQLPQTSQIKSSTAPITKPTPITGGLSRQTTTTTTQTTAYNQEKYEACQKKNDSIFSKIDNGLCWLNNNMIQPAWNGTKKFGKAVYHSTSLEVGLGFGIGVEGKLGGVNGSIMTVPVRNEYIFADDCKTNSTTKFSTSVDIGEILGIGFETKCSAYNGQGDGYSWMMDGHEWEYQAGLISKNGDYSFTNKTDPHFTLSVGGSAYLLVGADIALAFDVDEFLEQMGWE